MEKITLIGFDKPKYSAFQKEIDKINLQLKKNKQATKKKDLENQKRK